MHIYLLSLLFIIANCSLKIYYFDVGQGDSQLIVYPSGFTVLIDVGPENNAETTVYNRLVQLLGNSPTIDVLSLFILIIYYSNNTLSY